MSNRHIARSIVLQTLFEWDFKDKVDDVDKLVDYNINEFAPSTEKDDFLQFLIKGVTRNIKQIDKILKTYAPEWPIQQIAIVDRNILRIAIFELLYNDGAPYKVVINEAIELAKNFSSDNSSKFINGVLGAVIENMKNSTTNFYEFGLIMKNVDGNYLVTKTNDKFGFFRFLNLPKKNYEAIKEEEFKKRLEEEKLQTEKEKELKKEQKAKNKEQKIQEIKNTENNESDNDRLDIEKEDAANIEDEKEKKELELKNKEYLDYAKNEITNNFKLDNISDVKSIGEINYTIREDSKELFPKMVKKNILFIFVDNINTTKINFGNEIKWIKQDELLNLIDYKNIKNLIKNL